MKRLLFIIFVFQLSFSFLLAQPPALPAVDKSPMDISYYPTNYPVLKIQDKLNGPLLARVLYSRPRKEGRVIFGGLVEYGKIWRLGANEATEIEFFKHVKVGGKRIPRGRYTLYAIAMPNTWTIIINKETDTWGHFKYDPRKDVTRIDLTVQKTTDLVESMAMVFEKSLIGANLIIAWDNLKVAMPITF